MPSVSIVICTHDRLQALDGCLELMRQTIVEYGGNAEIVVVQNGSSADAGSVVERHGARYFHLEDGNKCAAMNYAVRQTDSEILAFADDDSYVREDWLSRMVEPILAGGHASVGSVQVPNSHRLPWMTEYHLSSLGQNDYMKSGRGDVIGGAMAVHRRVFDLVRGFDHELGPGGLGFGEDTLFSQQMKIAKMRIAYAMTAVADHCFDLSRLCRQEFFNRAIAIGKSIAYIKYHWEHSDKPKEYYESKMQGVRPLIEADAHLTANDPDAPALEHEMARHILLGECLQMPIEKTKPRNYRKFGLAKLPNGIRKRLRD